MPDIVSDDELNTLAAEYVLGTLDYQERRGASALLEVDPTFRGIVRIWERRFGDLHLMVEAVEPDPQLWERIRPKIPGIEQIALAIPSHTEEAAIVAAAAASVAEPAVQAEAVPPTETQPTDAPPTSPAATSADTVAAELKADIAAETPPPAIHSAESAPTIESTPTADSIPTDAVPPAIAETEIKLAELAALLPVAEHAAAGQTSTEQPAPEQAEPLPEDGLHTHAPDLVPRGFVPPAPMSTRGTPAVVEVPVSKTGRGWIAATVMMALLSVVLAGLIGAWRYFPERLPSSLRAYSVLNLPAPPASAPAPKPRPKPAPFDE